jgi:uncharacterized protein YuzE
MILSHLSEMANLFSVNEDTDLGALYVLFDPFALVHHTEHHDEHGISIDVDDTGKPVGVEFLF